MVLTEVGRRLTPTECAEPRPGAGQLVVRVRACAVCRTDLHVVDGELPDPKLPLIPGHEIVGVVEDAGDETLAPLIGRRVGIPWLGWTCGRCEFCRSGRENLCDEARFTGYQIDGGYAERTRVDHRFAIPLPDRFDDAHAAPLLCAGLIGYRALRMTGAAKRLGLYGFGAAAHLVAQIALHQGREVFAFTRSGDDEAQAFARSLGVTWAGSSEDRPPARLDAAILFAPVGRLVPLALACVKKGGTVVAGGIHMSDVPAFPYALLWGERVLRSVANVTRQDGAELFAFLEQAPIEIAIERYRLEAANEALDALRAGRVRGAAVLEIQEPQGPPPTTLASP